MKQNVAALILAAGKSERMNYPKPLLMFSDTKTFIEKIIEEFILFEIKTIVIVTNEFVYKYLKNFEIIISNNQKIKIIINTKLELGRFYSVKLGINEILKSNTDFTFLHNTDNPFVNQIILNKLFENKEDNFYNVPTFETQGGHPILISNTILKELQKYEDNSLLNKELSRFNKKKISTNDKNILININDLETYNLNTNIKNL